MMKKVEDNEVLQYAENLVGEIEKSYEDQVTIAEAERLAGKFLVAMVRVGNELAKRDLERRLRKRTLKTERSLVRLREIERHEKKPTEGYLEDIVNTDKDIRSAEAKFDESEVSKEQLEVYMGVFKEAHIYFRGIGKGKYE